MTNLNLIVDQYLSFAEFQARTRKAMYMSDWVAKLDGFMQLNEREILTHAGRVSAKVGDAKAEKELDKYWVKQQAIDAANPVADLDQAIRKVEAQRYQTKEKVISKKSVTKKAVKTKRRTTENLKP